MKSETPQHVRDNTYRLSNNNLSDRKPIGQIYKSDAYNELVKRSGAIQDVIIPVKGHTTQKHPLINTSYDDQSLPKETENTTGLLEKLLFVVVNLCILQRNSLPTHGLLN